MTAAPRTARGLRAFRHRNFRLFYAGQLVSLVGTWMQSVAQGWLVLSSPATRSRWASWPPPSSCR